MFSSENTVLVHFLQNACVGEDGLPERRHLCHIDTFLVYYYYFMETCQGSH